MVLIKETNYYIVILSHWEGGANGIRVRRKVTSSFGSVKVDELTALWSSFVDGEPKQDLLAIEPVRISAVIASG